MKVILLEDVKSLGKKDQLVDVSDGYARNVILKKKLGVEATPKAINELKLKKKHEDLVAKQQWEEAKDFDVTLRTKSVTVSIKTGQDGRVFGSISSKEISIAAKEQLGYDLDKKKMQLKEPIKSLGTFQIPIKLHPKVTSELKVIVKGQ